MKPPDKLRDLANTLYSTKIAEGLESIDSILYYHWRDAEDEPQSRKCQVKITGDTLYIQWVVDKNWSVVYQGPVEWLLGVRAYED